MYRRPKSPLRENKLDDTKKLAPGTVSGLPLARHTSQPQLNGTVAVALRRLLVCLRSPQLQPRWVTAVGPEWISTWTTHTSATPVISPWSSRAILHSTDFGGCLIPLDMALISRTPDYLCQPEAHSLHPKRWTSNTLQGGSPDKLFLFFF